MTSTILVPAHTGLTLTADVFPELSDTAIDSARSLTEKTNAKGWYTFTTTGSDTGIHRIVLKESGTAIGGGWVNLTNSGATEDHAHADYTDVLKFGGNNGTFNGGRPEVNTTQIGGQAVGLSSDNRLQVDVKEWNDVPLATTDKLDVLYTDWLDGGRLDLILDARASQASVDTAQADLDILTGTDGATLATSQANYAPAIAGDQMDLVNAPNATAVAAIQAGLATASALSTAQSGITTIQAITDAIGATAAANLAKTLGNSGVINGTVDTATNSHTPTTTEFQADDITEATNDHYNGRVVIWLTGALAGQATDITDYTTEGGIGQFTVTALTEAPANDDTFVII